MLVLKKLIFAPFFLIFFALLLSQLSLLLESSDFIFSISANSLIQLITISLFIMLTSFSFVLFASFSQDWKYFLIVGVLATIITFFFLEPGLAIVLAVVFLVSLLITFINLDTTLKTYVNFAPNSLFGPAMRHLGGLLILSICVVYFFSSNKVVAEKGFLIPDSLIDSAIKLSGSQLPNPESSPTSLSQISPEQLELLRQNPALLKQSGIDPKILDTIGKPTQNLAPQDLANNLIKQTVKTQVQDLIKPYTGFVPAILAVLLFLSLQSVISLINLLVYPLLWIVFYVLEKSGFIKFTEESRLVKKMVMS